MIDKTKKHSNKIIIEGEALSNPHTLNCTTSIDRTTMAQFPNATWEYDSFHRSHHALHHANNTYQKDHIHDQKARWKANYFWGFIYLYGLVPYNHRNRNRNRNNSHNHKHDKLSEAMRYLTVAANSGHAGAQYTVGIMHYHGYNCYYFGNSNPKYSICQIKKKQPNQ